MQLETNDRDIVKIPSLGHIIFGSDGNSDVNIIRADDLKAKFCSIVNDKSVCVLEVFKSANVFVNQRKIQEMAILHPGDSIDIEKNIFKLVDENKLPKACLHPLSNNQNSNTSPILTSVSGLRSYNKNDYGQIKIVGTKNSYTHKPSSADNNAFRVSYVEDNLAIRCAKGSNIKINGHSTNNAILRNGDFISTEHLKYCVESPGTSSFSKYSPSHPRNIQLSEEYVSGIEKNKQSSNTSFIKNNLWWITLLGGLCIIIIAMYIIKNS